MNINSRWFFRAAGTVGIAGGFLALAAGTAQADDAERVAASEEMNALLGDVFSPTSGLPPIDGLLLDGVPLDAAGLPGGMVGTGPPVDQLADLKGQVVGVPDLPTGDAPRTLPAQPNGVSGALPARTDSEVRPLAAAEAPRNQLDNLPAAQSAPVTHNAPAPQSAPAAHGSAELVGPMPFLTAPGADAVLGGQSLGQLVAVGDLAGQVPVAGPVASQTIGSLPLAGELTPSNDANQPLDVVPADPADLIAQTQPVTTTVDRPLSTGNQLPALIADDLAATGSFTPGLLSGAPATPGSEELLGGGLPLVGQAVEPLGRLVGVGNLGSQLPVAGPVAGSAMGSLPVVDGPGTGNTAAMPASRTGNPATPTRDPAPQDPATLAGDRPIAGEDPEFVESAELVSGDQVLDVLTQQFSGASPLGGLGSLPLVGGLGSTLPV